MSTELATSPAAQQPPQIFRQKPRALEIMAGRLSVEPSKMLETLKATVFKGASNEELLALTVVANEYDLNPFLKELYAFPAKGGGIVPVVSVDGWIKMLNRQEKFDGIDFEFQDGPDGKLVSCMAVIHIKGRSRPVAVQEFFSECSRNTDPWNKSPRRMLRHKALIQCARVAFGFSGVQDEEEARTNGDVDENRLATAKPVFSTAHALPAPAAAPQPQAEPTEVTQSGAGDGPTSSPVADQRGNSDAQTSTPAPSAPAASIPDDELLPRLIQLGENDEVSVEELTNWAIAKKMLQKGMVLTDLTPKRMRDIVEGWEKVKAEIVAKRA